MNSILAIQKSAQYTYQMNYNSFGKNINQLSKNKEKVLAKQSWNISAILFFNMKEAILNPFFIYSICIMLCVEGA